MEYDIIKWSDFLQDYDVIPYSHLKHITFALAQEIMF